MRFTIRNADEEQGRRTFEYLVRKLAPDGTRAADHTVSGTHVMLSLVTPRVWRAVGDVLEEMGGELHDVEVASSIYSRDEVMEHLTLPMRDRVAEG